jgi:hypothetical protein
MSDSAFDATFADFRLVKGRKVCQVILEIPIEAANHALSILGGIPNPEKTTWVGVAAIKKKPVLSGKNVWRASAECAMLCKEKSFQGFMHAVSEMHAVDLVRTYCEINSRQELDRDGAAAERWQELKAKYEKWVNP